MPKGMLKEVETEKNYLHYLFNKGVAKASFTARTLWR